MRTFAYKFWIALLFSGLLLSCNNDDEGSSRTTSSASDFVYQAMNLWYFYQEDVPDLADNRFGSVAERDAFLAGFDGPDAVFDALLFEPTDRFSAIFADLSTLTNSFQGISTSFGYEFALIAVSPGANEVFGFVQYVVPNSPAAAAGIERGDLFTQVNGQTLTRNNFANLLFGNQSYTIGFANLENGTLTSNGETASITAVELTENPILLSTVIEQENTRIGYLVYNSFVASFDTQLNSAIGQLAAQGIDELVVDLRHNGGGSLASSVALGSMITGQFTGQPFVELRFNSKVSNNNRTENFSNQTSNGTPLNSLGLDHVYVILSGSSASASELLVNSLKPYITVTTVGTRSVGKNVGQIPLYDSPGSNFTDVNSASSQHRWALLPITFSYFNSEGSNDFGQGITPDIVVNEFEFLDDIRPLGDPEEVVLKAAIDDILNPGQTASSIAKSVGVGGEQLTNSNAQKLLGNTLYLER